MHNYQRRGNRIVKILTRGDNARVAELMGGGLLKLRKWVLREDENCAAYCTEYVD